MRTALILGSTGKLGRTLTDYLLNNRQYKNIKVLLNKDSRKLISFNLTKIIADFNNANDIKTALKDTDYLFICIGSKYSNDIISDDDADYDVPFKVATLAKEQGVCIVTIVNTPYANPNSHNLYEKKRGLLITNLKELGFKTLNILEVNHIKKGKAIDPMYRLLMSNIFNKITFGFWQTTRPLNVNYVAKAMIKASLAKKEGINYFKPSQIKTL